MTLIILICHMYACDRIAQPVETCINSAMMAQAILAQTNLYKEGDHLQINCVPTVVAH